MEPAKKENKQKKFKCQQKCTRKPKKPRPLTTIPSMPLKKRKSVIPAKLHISTAIKKVTLPITAPS